MNRGIEDFFTVKPDVEKPLVVGELTTPVNPFGGTLHIVRGGV
jgi:hypothetical protein